MKLSALASMIKDCGRCSQITAANGHRFISTGYAVYNMDGYPKAQNTLKTKRNAKNERRKTACECSNI